jgi:predicted ATPase
MDGARWSDLKMLTSLSLTNFKAWKRIDKMRLAPITGLFGSNSSGKSSILQFLLMLKQTADSPDRQQVLFLGEEKSEKSLAVFGTFDDLLYKGAANKCLGMSLSWSMAEALEIKDPEGPRRSLALSGRDITYEAEISRDSAGAPSVSRMSYEFANHAFVMQPVGGAKNGTPGKYDLTTTGNGFVLNKIQGRPKAAFSSPIKCYGFPDDVRAAYQNAGVLSDLELAFEQQMQRTFYLGPLREYPYRDYRWSGAEPQDMGRRGEKFVAALLSAAQRKVKFGKGNGAKTLEEKVAYWLKQLGLIHDFKVVEVNKSNNLYEVRVQRSSDSAPVLLPDVGFGVSQVLPVIVLCYYVPQGSTILLEQPEIHLHPMVQRGLADVFIDVATRRNVQIIVESHSEHMLRRLQRRVAEEALSKEQAALYFCSANNGASEKTDLDLNLFGDIENWPPDFFGNELEDIIAMAERARARRSKGEA